MSIHLTQAQARAVADIAVRDGELSLHQLTHDDSGRPAEDVYVTRVSDGSGYRVAADGEIGAIAESVAAGLGPISAAT
jgi:hypothetical protein